MHICSSNITDWKQPDSREGNGHHGPRNGGRRNNNGNKHNNGPKDGHRQGKKEIYKGEERPKKDAILDLSKYLDKAVIIRFSGGREITGLLKGYDQLMNLVVDETKEKLRDPDDENVLLDKTRDLGTVVVRGPLLQSIAPVDGTEEIANPFVQPEA